jgi:hypothetical protein
MILSATQRLLGQCTCIEEYFYVCLCLFVCGFKKYEIKSLRLSNYNDCNQLLYGKDKYRLRTSLCHWCARCGDVLKKERNLSI